MPSTSSSGNNKRPRQTPPGERPPTKTPPPTTAPSNHTTSFRNVSACYRCRNRKNRCDLNLPACSACAKAGAKCVGFDPVTKREIPREYVYYLEGRVTHLEALLTEHDIPFASSHDFDLGPRPIKHELIELSTDSERPVTSDAGAQGQGDGRQTLTLQSSVWEQKQKQGETDKLNKLMSNIGMVSVQGTSDSRYLGSTSGISFARVVLAAIRSSVSSPSTEKARSARVESTASPTASSGTSMRDSFFGLQTKPTIKQAPFPIKDLGARLANLYFEHANPQIPILHRREFHTMFDKAYQAKGRPIAPRDLYMLNIVFAIGAGIILEDSNNTSPRDAASARDSNTPNVKRQRLSAHQCQPEEYHASAIVHLESYLGSTPTGERLDGTSSGLEELQAVLLLAGFALLRPVAPGLWYIVGVAVRLAVDLGLHHEDSSGGSDGTAGSQDVAMKAAGNASSGVQGMGRVERGRRQWVHDLRRRLWWCVYSFDRLVSTCVGRPFGITDQVITTEFPSILDDSSITTSGFTISPDLYDGPSYKRVSHHYFRLRLLQSEILQVLQYQQAQQEHHNRKGPKNEFMHTELPSPFMQNFDSFQAWRRDIDRRLWEWKENAPYQAETAVQFSVQFLELNYWQAVIMLYRQSLSIPPVFAGEITPSDEVASSMTMHEDKEDEDEIFLKVAEAGQKVLKLYRQLHRVRLVNYTFLATHHLFMAGIGFLYAIWHSGTVRSRLTPDDVDFTILAATSVLGDLIEKCPPAEACRDAFDRMSKATVRMCMSTTGFGRRVPDADIRPATNDEPDGNQLQGAPRRESLKTARPAPQFDMDLRDLFPKDIQDERGFVSDHRPWQYPPTSNPMIHTSIADKSNYTHDNSHSRGSSADPGQYDSPMSQDFGSQAANSTSSPYGTYGTYGYPSDMNFLMNDATTHGGSLDCYPGIYDYGTQWHIPVFDGFFFGWTDE